MKKIVGEVFSIDIDEIEGDPLIMNQKPHYPKFLIYQLVIDEELFWTVSFTTHISKNLFKRIESRVTGQSHTRRFLEKTITSFFDEKFSNGSLELQWVYKNYLDDNECVTVTHEGE